jgi:uncharacterized membrane protein YfcA
VVGLVAGVIGGATSLFGMPILLYVIALNPPKEQFVGAVTANYLIGGVALSVMLAKLEILTGGDAVIAGIGLVPLFAGVAAGQFLRGKASQELFRRIVLTTLVCIGLAMILRNFL